MYAMIGWLFIICWIIGKIKYGKSDKKIDEYKRYPNSHIGDNISLKGYVKYIEEKDEGNTILYSIEFNSNGNTVILLIRLNKKEEKILVGDYMIVKGFYKKNIQGFPLIWVTEYRNKK